MRVRMKFLAPSATPSSVTREFSTQVSPIPSSITARDFPSRSTTHESFAHTIGQILRSNCQQLLIPTKIYITSPTRFRRDTVRFSSHLQQEFGFSPVLTFLTGLVSAGASDI